MKLLVSELITFEPVLPIKVSLWKPSFSTDHIHKVLRKPTELRTPSAIKAGSLHFSHKLFHLNPSVVIYRREITKMCNDQKSMVLMKKWLKSLLKLTLYIQMAPLRFLFTVVWKCVCPDFLFFVCLSHFYLDQFAVSHDLQDVTEKQKQEHTAGSCQTKLDKKKRDNSVGQNGVGRCVCKLPMWRVGQESMLFTCRSIKMEKCLKHFQEEAFAVYQEDETIIRLTVWKAPAVWCEAADVKDVWPRRKKKSLFFFLSRYIKGYRDIGIKNTWEKVSLVACLSLHH